MPEFILKRTRVIAFDLIERENRQCILDLLQADGWTIGESQDPAVERLVMHDPVTFYRMRVPEILQRDDSLIQFLVLLKIELISTEILPNIAVTIEARFDLEMLAEVINDETWRHSLMEHTANFANGLAAYLHGLGGVSTRVYLDRFGTPFVLDLCFETEPHDFAGLHADFARLRNRTLTESALENSIMLQSEAFLRRLPIDLFNTLAMGTLNTYIDAFQNELLLIGGYNNNMLDGIGMPYIVTIKTTVTSPVDMIERPTLWYPNSYVLLGLQNSSGGVLVWLILVYLWSKHLIEEATTSIDTLSSFKMRKVDDSMEDLNDALSEQNGLFSTFHILISKSESIMRHYGALLTDLKKRVSWALEEIAVTPPTPQSKNAYITQQGSFNPRDGFLSNVSAKILSNLEYGVSILGTYQSWVDNLLDQLTSVIGLKLSERLNLWTKALFAITSVGIIISVTGLLISLFY